MLKSLQSFLSYLPALTAAVTAVFHYVYTSVICGEPVSYPGGRRSNCKKQPRLIFFLPGPRKKALTRRGAWRNQTTQLSRKWKFAEDAESYAISETRSDHKLTGESAGRQIWYSDEQEEGEDAYENGFDFNASINPNSSDQIFRDIMLSKWYSPPPWE